jgi:hypothetical protein
MLDGTVGRVEYGREERHGKGGEERALECAERCNLHRLRHSQHNDGTSLQNAVRADDANGSKTSSASRADQYSRTPTLTDLTAVQHPDRSTPLGGG